LPRRGPRPGWASQGARPGAGSQDLERLRGGQARLIQANAADGALGGLGLCGCLQGPSHDRPGGTACGQGMERAGPPPPCSGLRCSPRPACRARSATPGARPPVHPARHHAHTPPRRRRPNCGGRCFGRWLRWWMRWRARCRSARPRRRGPGPARPPRPRRAGTPRPWPPACAPPRRCPRRPPARRRGLPAVGVLRLGDRCARACVSGHAPDGLGSCSLQVQQCRTWRPSDASDTMPAGRGLRGERARR